MPQIQSEYLLRNLVEAAPDAILVVDPSGKILLINKQGEDLFGYSRSELVGKAVEILIPQKYLATHEQNRLEYMADPALRPMGAGRNLVARRKDGREVAVDIMLSPIKDENGTSVIVTTRDATERRLTEQKLVASEAMFRALYDQAPDAIIAVDKNGRIVQLNRKVEEYFGYAPNELVSQAVETIIPDRFRKLHIAQRNGYIETPHTRPMGAGMELYAKRKNGTEFPVDIMLSPVQIPGNSVVICVIRDITDRKKAERQAKQHAEQLARSNAELERFAYVASHDLQEPLRAVAASCQVMQRRLSGKFDSDTNEYIEFAIDGAKRMQELINDLLTFSRVTRGGEVLKKTDINQVFERVLLNLEVQIKQTQAKITRSVFPTVWGDFGQLVQLFQNLLSNAIKFHGDKTPEVSITFLESSEEWTFCLKDNGIGIPPEYHHKIFVIFQRLHRREEYAGTGIGLAICKKIVEHHGGRIWLESIAGEGCSFYFTFPKRQPHHEPH